MVNIDFTRDYYGDLGLTPDASEADIKKQFRKLALQYHPDRNRGNEQAANDKFQIIGAAHEILSDSAQRFKYNAGRAQHTSTFPRASGVRGNPWANAGSQFQPPPRRGNPRPASTSSKPSAQPPTGTGRFSNFATGVPPTAKQSSNSTDGLKSAYTAWQNMRSGESTMPRRPTAPPPPPRPAPPEPSQRPVPQTPTAKARTEAAFGTDRKGFHTRAPGDEAPVSSSNYSTGGWRTAPVDDLFGDDSDEFKPSPPPRPKKTPIPKDQAFADTSSESEPERPWTGERPPFPPPRRRATGRRPQGGSEHTQGSSRDGSFGAGAESASSPGGSKPSNMYDTRNLHPAIPRTGIRLIPKPIREALRYMKPNPPAFSGPGTPPELFRSHSSASGYKRKYAPPSFQHEAMPEFPTWTRYGFKEMKLPPSPVTKTRTVNFGFDNLANQLPKDPVPSTLSRSNTDNIETQFSPRTAESFTFSAGGSVGSPKIGSKASSPSKSTFDPATWSAKLGETNVFSPPPPSRGSPTRPSTSRRPTIRKGSMDSATAMDIDSPPRGNTPSSGPPIPPKEREQASHARNVPVEPAKKEWRSGELGGKPTRRKTGDSHGHGGSGGSSSSSSSSAGPPPSRKFRGSEDMPEFFEDLKDLRNVEPFTAPHGLDGMSSLRTNLPFDSKAGSRPVGVSQPSTSAPVPLDFPQPPNAPVPPMAAYTGNALHAIETQRYILEFQEYLRKWEKWNSRVVSHFAMRQSEVERVRASLGVANLIGDRQLLEQLEWARQDREVRSRWNQAWERYEEELRNFMAIKEQVS